MSKLKLIYLYIFSTVGLVLAIIGGVSLINLALKTYIFTKADAPYIYRGPVPAKVLVDETGKETLVNKEPTEEEIKLQEEQEKENRPSQRQRDAAQAVAMLIVGIPVYLYHWREVRRKDL